MAIDMSKTGRILDAIRNACNGDILDEDVWEVCVVRHDGKCEKKLSIRKDEKYRSTYCPKCGKVVDYERVERT